MEDALPPPSSASVVSLLGLPGVLLLEVLGWSPDWATANALLRTCTVLHALRQDPAAAALLLVRCECKDPAAAVTSCGRTCSGGTAAVVAQVLRRLVVADGEGTTHVPQLWLLHALLCASAEGGAAANIHTIMSLPQPPPIAAADNKALMAAVRNGHLAATQALLDHGAFSAYALPHTNPGTRCSIPAHSLGVAASSPAGVGLLPLLRQHCPPEALALGLEMALHQAVLASLPDVVALLLPDFPACGAHAADAWKRKCMAQFAAQVGSPAVLCLLLDHWALTTPYLNMCLGDAVHGVHVGCVEALLAAGAEASPPSGGCMLKRAIGSLNRRGVSEEAVLDVLQLLLQRGAPVAAGLLTAAGWHAGHPNVVDLLQAAFSAQELT